jgi:hypothetical protein
LNSQCGGYRRPIDRKALTCFEHRWPFGKFVRNPFQVQLCSHVGAVDHLLQQSLALGQRQLPQVDETSADSMKPR